MGQASPAKGLLAQEPAGATQLTSIQQQLDRQVVVGEHRVVQSRAAPETGSDVQAVVEFVLPGHKDCRGRRTKAQLTERGKVKNCLSENELSSMDHPPRSWKLVKGPTTFLRRQSGP